MTKAFTLCIVIILLSMLESMAFKKSVAGTGKVVGLIYTPAQSHSPESREVVIQTKDETFMDSINAQRFYQLKIGDPISYLEWRGQFTGINYFVEVQ